MAGPRQRNARQGVGLGVEAAGSRTGPKWAAGQGQADYRAGQGRSGQAQLITGQAARQAVQKEKGGERRMDTQRKKGLLDVCVLAVLQRGPSYGYRIVREVSACMPVSESTLYPILRRLEANGFLTTYAQQHNGRQRRYYRITDAGRQRIREFLGEWEEVRRIYAFIEEAGMPPEAERAVEQT